MNLPPKYRYVDEHQGGNVPLQIMDGKYEGIIVQYNKVMLEEKEDGIHFNYDYDILDNPDNFEENEELQNVLSSIMISVMEEQIGVVPDDMDLLKEGSSEEHRESDSPKSNIQ